MQMHFVHMMARKRWSYALARLATQTLVLTQLSYAQVVFFAENQLRNKI